MKLVLKSDLGKRQTPGGNKVLLIKHLFYQDLRATLLNFIRVSVMLFLKRAHVASVNPNLRLKGRRQEKERAAFSQN